MRPEDPFIGRDILNGQFQILQKIGSGGMGAVYKALQPDMNRMVGVKILHPKLANRKDLVSRFRREARAMSQLTHPNTVKVFLYGELDDGSLYIIMEFLEGKNLNQTVRAEGPFPLERALPILIAGVRRARRGAQGRHHPPGLEAGEHLPRASSDALHDYPKVLDFGLAKVGERQMRPGSIILTQEGMVFGTPEFMSPEQAQGKTADARERRLLARRHPLRGAHGQAPLRREERDGFHPAPRHRQAHPAQPARPRTDLPAVLEQILDRALAKRAEDRFSSAAELAVALQAVLQGATALPPQLVETGKAVARPGPQGHRPEALPATSRPSPGQSPSPPVVARPIAARPGSRNSLLLLLGVAAAFLLIGIGLAVVLMKAMR